MKYFSKFQFVLVNAKNDIICQRYFQINGYKEDIFVNIFIIKELIDLCTNLIKNDLKIQSEKYQYKQNKIIHPSKTKPIKHSVYIVFKIIVDDRIRIIKSIPTGIYPSKIRYNINIRKQISPIIQSIQDTLSKKFCMHI